jgi:hypothetical protein
MHEDYTEKATNTKERNGESQKRRMTSASLFFLKKNDYTTKML